MKNIQIGDIVYYNGIAHIVRAVEGDKLRIANLNWTNRRATRLVYVGDVTPKNK